MLRKQQSRNAGRKRADLQTFDREKFYKRLGVDLNQVLQVQEEDVGSQMIAEVCEASEYGSVGYADSEEITLEKKSVNKLGRTPKAD